MIQAEKKVWLKFSWGRILTSKMQGCPYTKWCAKNLVVSRTEKHLSVVQTRLNHPHGSCCAWMHKCPVCRFTGSGICRCWGAPAMGLPRGPAASTGCSSPPDCFVHPASDSVASKATQSILWSSAYCISFRLLTCICLSFQICWFFTILHSNFVVVSITVIWLYFGFTYNLLDQLFGFALFS